MGEATRERPDPDAPFWSPKETAIELGVGLSTVYDLAEAGKIRHTRVGPNRGRLKFRPADVMAYIEEGMRGPKGGAEEPRPKVDRYRSPHDFFGERRKPRRS